MNLPITVTQNDLLEILINIAPVRPVFIWGAPGIGKSALVEQFAREVGLPCVSCSEASLLRKTLSAFHRSREKHLSFFHQK